MPFDSGDLTLNYGSNKALNRGAEAQELTYGCVDLYMTALAPPGSPPFYSAIPAPIEFVHRDEGREGEEGEGFAHCDSDFGKRF